METIRSAERGWSGPVLAVVAALALGVAATRGFAYPFGHGLPEETADLAGVLVAGLGGLALGASRGRRPALLAAGSCVAGSGLALVLGQVVGAACLGAAGVSGLAAGAFRGAARLARRGEAPRALVTAAAAAAVAVALELWEHSLAANSRAGHAVDTGLLLIELAVLGVVWAAMADGAAAVGLAESDSRCVAAGARRAAVWAGTAVAAFAALWLLFPSPAGIWLDAAATRALHDRGGEAARQGMQALTDLGGREAVLVWLPLLAGGLIWTKHARSLRLLGAALLGYAGWELLIKNLALRARPPFGHRPHFDSFPSGHVLAATVLALTLVMILWPACRRLRERVLLVVVGAGWPLLMALTRVYLGRHYLTDVLAAIALGIAWVSACRAAILSLAAIVQGPSGGADSGPPRVGPPAAP
jgi:membrane-associated phospholipid phosphatase